MRSTEDDFFVNVAHALAGCPHVEQELELYITEALDLAKTCIRQKILFNMRDEDYADSSLEKPIDIFKKLSDDETLVTELQQFKKERKFLSHRAITDCLDGEGSLPHSRALELQGRLEAIQREAQRLRQAIFDKAAILALM